MGTYPDTIPEAYSTHQDLKAAYRAGWQSGHGHACHCVPSLGDRISPDVDYWGLGRTVDESNIRDYHQLLTFHRASETRPEYPEMSEDKDGPTADDCLEAFSQGETDSIFADLATYTGEDYGIEEEEEDRYCPSCGEPGNGSECPTCADLHDKAEAE